MTLHQTIERAHAPRVVDRRNMCQALLSPVRRYKTSPVPLQLEIGLLERCPNPDGDLIGPKPLTCHRFVLDGRPGEVQFNHGELVIAHTINQGTLGVFDLTGSLVMYGAFWVVGARNPSADLVFRVGSIRVKPAHWRL